MYNPRLSIGEWTIELVKDSHPSELMIEVTTKCNYECIYCFRKNLLEHELGSMNPRLFYTIIDEASEIGVRRISFSGWGEPLIHPNIMDLISYAKENKMEVLLNTNGYFLEEYVDELFHMQIDEIIVSIDSADDNVYSIIRRGGELARIVNALLRLKELKIEHQTIKPYLSIQYTINRYNYRNLLPMIKLARELGAYQITVSNVIPLNSFQEQELACYYDKKCINEVEKLRIEIAKLSLEYNVNLSFPNFTLKTERVCPFVAKKATFIRFDGGVSPCIYYAHGWVNTLYGIRRIIEPVIFGYLPKRKLIDIWRDPSYVKFRIITYFMHQPSCLDCSLREYCTITLSNIYDCWGNQPTCAHCPYSRDLVRCPL